MFEISFFDIDKEENILISKNNKIIYKTEKDKNNLINKFYKVLIEKDENYKILIDKKNINSKNTILINLIDFTNIIENLKYKKGMLLYLYINNIISKKSIDYNKIIEEFKNYYEEKLSDIEIAFSLEEEIIEEKVFNAIFSLNIDINFDSYQEKVITILNELIKQDFAKNYICLYNSSYITIDYNYNNLFLFDLNENISIFDQNIMIDNSIKNTNIDLLIEEVKEKFPILIEEQKIKELITHYFKYFYKKDIINSDNRELIIISLIFNDIFSQEKNIIYENKKVTNFKSILT